MEEIRVVYSIEGGERVLVGLTDENGGFLEVGIGHGIVKPAGPILKHSDGDGFWMLIVTPKSFGRKPPGRFRQWLIRQGLAEREVV